MTPVLRRGEDAAVCWRQRLTPQQVPAEVLCLFKLEIWFWCVATHSSFAAVIKCAAEIKMDLVCIHLSCVQKH